MNVSPKTLKWLLRFYPPLFFQRIWVVKFGEDFTWVEVKINKSILNINYNKTLFGGTIFSASDPFYAILFDQILQKKGFKELSFSGISPGFFYRKATSVFYKEGNCFDI